MESQNSGENISFKRLAPLAYRANGKPIWKGGLSGKGGNFVETILAKAKAGESLRLVDDIRMSPTYTRDAAQALERLLRKGL